MTITNTDRISQRGAVLIMVVVAMVALLALCAFVVDYGVMWVSRGQAQTAADAAAMTGVMALSFESATDAVAKDKSVAVARANSIWGTQPNVAAGDIYIEGCPPTLGWAPATCVRAEVFRNQGRSPLPTMFGPLVGVTSQGVRATATARAISANSANCLRPWVVADKWLESAAGGWTQQSLYEPPADVYTPPSATSSGTGFSNKDANGNPVDAGLQLSLKLAHSGPPATPGTLTAGWSMAVDLPNASVPAYASNISGCTTATVGIAAPGEQCLTVDPSRGCLDVFTGAQTGPVANPNGALAQLIATDSGASWSGGAVINSNAALSPRVVPVAVFDPALYISQGYNGTQGIIKIVNILGFFIEGKCSATFYHEPYLDCSNNGNDIVGRLVSYPGLVSAGSGTVAGAAFGQVIVLVR
jgi:Putative Flp pilus-assembly TadE/G-like